MNNINLLYVDLFCGAGGTSTGVESARINGEQCAKIIACVNHDTNAIASHAANHPEAMHFTEDIRTLELSALVAHVQRMKQLYPDAHLVLWASLECTNFSKAKGGQPRDADSRTLAEHLFRYIEAINPDYIQIENVEEFMSWGDMDENGKPISMDKGRQGAPNMYSGKNTASERLQVRYDRLMKERNENARAYLSGLFGAMQADDVKARDDRNWRHQLAREKRADAIADAKEKRDNQMFDLNVKLQNNKISAAEADAERKRVEAEYADDLAKARLETEKAKAGASKASASASNARAGYYNRGGSGGNKKRMTLTIDGKTTYYDTKEDYERAVQREAKRLGIKTHQYVKTTENDVMGAKEKNVSTPKPISQLAGEVETASNKKKSPTAGDNSSNKKKSPTS